MHGHMQPQQHPGMHPAHQPPPHLTHLTTLQPHNMQRDHPANRLNQAPRHHHPRGGGGGGMVDHSQQNAPGMAPHLPMQVPPPTPPQTHQSQNAGRKGGGYYGMPHPNAAGMPKTLPMTSPHLHGPPPQQGPPPPHQHQHLNPMSVVGGKPPLPYGAGSGATGMGQMQTMQPPPPIPVVSAATPAGTKTRHIPSNTDHKIHHHGHHVLQTNGNVGPGSKGIANHHQTTQQPVLTMDKTKPVGGNGHSGGNRNHHNHHHIQHQQQQPQQQQQQHQHIVSKPNDAPVPKESPVAVIPVTAPSVPQSTLPNQHHHHHQQQQQHDLSSTGTTAPNGGASSPPSSACETSARDISSAAATAASASSSDDTLEALANIKEKTTMCLVNELARYNKIQHQYRLTGEAGPAHKKHFTVTLKLGDEEYTAEGASIKKAQHKAAGDAIAATKYKHPPARTNRRKKTGTTGNVSSFTPTVELNALAMKRGEPTVYQVKAVPMPVSKYGGGGGGGDRSATSAPTGGRRPVDEKSAPPGVGHHHQQPPPPPSYWCRGNAGPNGGGIAAGVGGRGAMGGFHPGHQQQQQHHGHHDRHHGSQHSYHHHDTGGGYGGHHGGGGPGAPLVAVQEFYKAVLRVGERTFLGEGHTLQAARHDAAARALEVLKPLTATDGTDTGKVKSGDGLTNGGDASSPADGSTTSDDPNSELKSPISLVHEIAVQRSLSVVFEVISEKGPPHMTVFVTQCKVGTIVTEGEGTGKKLSKKRAAERMLEELRKLQKAEQAAFAASSAAASSSSTSWPDGAVSSISTPSSAEKRKSNAKAAAAATGDGANGAAAKKKVRNLIKERSAADVAEKENPISRLMQIQQARKEKQPVYTLVENERPNVGRRRQFTIEVSASGRQATGVGMTKKAAKWNAAEALLVELGYATATESKGSPIATAAATAVENKENQSGAANDSSPSGGKRPRKVRFQSEAATAAAPSATGQMLTNGVNQGKGETSNDSMNDSIASNDSAGTNSSGVSSASSVTPKADIGAKKEQLLYLAQLLKFEVQFSDFPKGNHGEYLTLVILSTEPPQLCHGSGASLQESHDEAARGALEMLSKIGLDNVKPKAPTCSTNTTASDDAITSTPAAAPSTPVTTSGSANGK